MCNWGISRAYSSLSDQDHISILSFLTMLLKLNVITEYDINYFLLMSGSNYRIQDPDMTRQGDIADRIAGILYGSVRRSSGKTKKKS